LPKVARPGVLSGKAEGIINAPLHIVWTKAQDFWDLSWSNDKFVVKDLGNNTRLATLGFIVAEEKLIEQY
jgi:hypothetical protein